MAQSGRCGVELQGALAVPLGCLRRLCGAQLGRRFPLRSLALRAIGAAPTSNNRAPSARKAHGRGIFRGRHSGVRIAARVGTPARLRFRPLQGARLDEEGRAMRRRGAAVSCALGAALARACADGAARRFAAWGSSPYAQARREARRRVPQLLCGSFYPVNGSRPRPRGQQGRFARRGASWRGKAWRCESLRGVVSRGVTSRGVGSRSAAPRRVGSRGVASLGAVSRGVSSRGPALRRVALRCVVLRCVALRCVAFLCVASHCAVWFGAGRPRG